MKRMSAGTVILLAAISGAHAQSAGQWVLNAGPTLPRRERQIR